MECLTIPEVCFILPICLIIHLDTIHTVIITPTVMAATVLEWATETVISDIATIIIPTITILIIITLTAITILSFLRTTGTKAGLPTIPAVLLIPIPTTMEGVLPQTLGWEVLKPGCAPILITPVILLAVADSLLAKPTDKTILAVMAAIMALAVEA